MPIISAIGRKHWKVRALFTGMYLFLVIGAASMVYPFMLMLAGSTKSAVDIKYFEAIPRFLYDDTWLYRKHIEGLFNESLMDENVAYDRDDSTFENVAPPATVNQGLLNEWRTFLLATPLPLYAYQCGYLNAPMSRTIPSGLRAFKQALMARYGQDIIRVNRALGTEFETWNNVRINANTCLDRRNNPMATAFVSAGNEFKTQLPVGWRSYASPDGYYKKMYIKPVYGNAIDDYNREHGTRHGAYDKIRLARTWAENGTPKEQEDWEQFVRMTLSLQWIRVDAVALPEYRQYLQAKHDTIAILNKYYGTAYRSFNDIPLITEPPLAGMALSDWEAFIAGWKDPDTKRLYQAPVAALRIHSVDWLFRDYLTRKYGSPEDLNRRLDTRYKTMVEIRPPQREFHYAWFLENRRALRIEFVTRNYKTVAEYILFHGRGIINTVIYCGLAVLVALLVNPLAAYALSRYKMSSTYKILLFLMATMAFPPMVTQIPNFLMLRQLNLLNTFAALILPGMANGYSIFLLKGFFDSLPRELYESAELDGASEWTIFWQLTMALSKPILAVIALAAFTAAYSNFMFAFVVCQDEKMWTLMVWLYQLQQMSGQSVMYASLIIAAIPTFVIFLFCQNIIMRGIVVPSEK
ncbi:MAG: ABC transporter permease subunit [Verrucomicrobia bacterium]|nr:ABC transporter permease subunit [Verrucomicrobiota bacterium]MBU1736383.1 ABC transporter permease subunit [Verrucomicrobiota bacterium]MBU1855458.1 ABC transporter permease subunit [Verrucomicrobiota bacterium]